MTTRSRETMTINGWTPKDYGAHPPATASARWSMASAIPQPAAVRTEYALGVLPIATWPWRRVSCMRRGPTPRTRPPTPSPWGRSDRPLDLADGAATIADLGVHHAPAPVGRSRCGERRSGLDYNAAPTPSRVVPENVAYIMDETLSKATYRLAAFGHVPEAQPARSPGQRHTGTSGSGYTTSTTGRSAGPRPSFTRSGWATPRARAPQTGSHRCHQRCDRGGRRSGKAFMEGATAGTPAIWYQTPSDVYQAGGSWYLPAPVPDSSMGAGGPICDPGCVGSRPRRTPPSPSPITPRRPRPYPRIPRRRSAGT